MAGRLEREKITLQLMIKIYCKGQHRSVEGLCSECRVVLDYAADRLTQCKFGEGKPTCAKCSVHCYKPEMRTSIKKIMRYAGPRIGRKHPIIAMRHILDGLKK